MRIAVAVATRNRPEWVRMFCLQMANQTVRPDVIVIHENGQLKPMKELFSDMPIEIDCLFTRERLGTPDFAIPALKRAIEAHNPDVVFMMNDDNIYLSTHIEKTIEGLKDGAFDVSYHTRANILATKGDYVEYFKNIQWSENFGNIGVDDGFAMSNRAARQYLAYLEFAAKACKEKGWVGKYDQRGRCPATDHHSDGVRYAYLLHPNDDNYNYLRRVNFISVNTMAWVRHDSNLCSPFDATLALMSHFKAKQLWEEGRV